MFFLVLTTGLSSCIDLFETFHELCKQVKTHFDWTSFSRDEVAIFLFFVHSLCHKIASKFHLITFGDLLSHQTLDIAYVRRTKSFAMKTVAHSMFTLCLQLGGGFNSDLYPWFWICNLNDQTGADRSRSACLAS